MQTAWKTAEKELVREARIDLTTPIRTTILNKDIEIIYEVSPLIQELQKAIAKEKVETENECKKIEEDCIVKEPINNYDYNLYKNNGWNGYDYNDKYGKKYDSDTYDNNMTDSEKLYGDIDVIEHKNNTSFNNELVNGFLTSEEERVSVEFKIGRASCRERV